MGLLQNGYRHRLTQRVIGATNLDGANAYVLVYQGHLAAANRNSLLGLTDSKASIPNGNRPHSAWVMANDNGGMSAVEYGFAITATADGVMGLPGEGSASFSITVADADGQLISSGEGSASFTITTNEPLLTASIGGEGEATFSITTNTPTLGAEASLIASATISFSGSLTPYAIGIMEGTTDVDTGVPTADQNASAVWSRILSNAQTAEDTLLAAGSAGDPWSTPLPGSYSESQAGGIIDIIHKIMRNKTVTDPATGKITVYESDGETVALEANLYEDAAGLVPYRGQGAENKGRLN